MIMTVHIFYNIIQEEFIGKEFIIREIMLEVFLKT